MQVTCQSPAAAWDGRGLFWAALMGSMVDTFLPGTPLWSTSDTQRAPISPFGSSTWSSGLGAPGRSRPSPSLFLRRNAPRWSCGSGAGPAAWELRPAGSSSARPEPLRRPGKAQPRCSRAVPAGAVPRVPAAPGWARRAVTATRSEPPRHAPTRSLNAPGAADRGSRLDALGSAKGCPDRLSGSFPAGFPSPNGTKPWAAWSDLMAEPAQSQRLNPGPPGPSSPQNYPVSL